MTEDHNNQDDIAIQLEELAESIADIMNNTLHHYWFSSTDAESAIIKCYKLLIHILHDTEQAAFRIFDGTMIVNGKPIKNKTHNLEVLLDHLSELEIDNFTLKHGISQTEFSNFLEIIEANSAELEQLDGFAACLERFNIKGVETRKLVFQEITENEVVVDKDKAGSGDSDGVDSVGSILAFLKGDVEIDNKDALSAVQDNISDSAKMAELILNAAEVRQSQVDIEGGESMIDFVVGCLRRTYSGLKQDKSAKTKTGKKRISRNLLLLEQEVLDRMRSMSEDWDDDDLQAIVDATQEMTDELKIDTLADDFITKQKASDDTRKRMLDYIESMGIENVDKLKQKMAERGMSANEWQELIIKSSLGGGMGPGGAGGGSGTGGEGKGPGDGGEGKGPGDGASGTGMASGMGLGAGSGFALGSLIEAISHLDVLLGSMEETVAHSDEAVIGGNRNELITVLENVTGQVKVLTAETGQKIQQLTKNVQADAKIIEAAEARAIEAGVEIRVTRKEIFDNLKAIVSDIIEPLEVIRASLKLMQSNTMGGLNEAQSHTVHLAVQNINIIDALLQKLSEITRQ